MVVQTRSSTRLSRESSPAQAPNGLPELSSLPLHKYRHAGEHGNELRDLTYSSRRQNPRNCDFVVDPADCKLRLSFTSPPPTTTSHFATRLTPITDTEFQGPLKSADAIPNGSRNTTPGRHKGPIPSRPSLVQISPSTHARSVTSLEIIAMVRSALPFIKIC